MKEKEDTRGGSFGAYVKKERLRHGYTQDQLAELCDLSNDQIQNIEINKRNPSFDSLITIMRVLDLSFDRFVFNFDESQEADMLADRIRLLPQEDVRFLQAVLNDIDHRDREKIAKASANMVVPQ